MKRSPSPATKNTAGRREAAVAAGPRKAARPSGGPSTRPGGVPQRGQHIRRAERDVERGAKDTERRGIPSDVPRGKGAGR
jgi:hypothetical protein